MVDIQKFLNLNWPVNIFTYFIAFFWHFCLILSCIFLSAVSVSNVCLVAPITSALSICVTTNVFTPAAEQHAGSTNLILYTGNIRRRVDVLNTSEIQADRNGVRGAEVQFSASCTKLYTSLVSQAKTQLAIFLFLNRMFLLISESIISSVISF